MNERRLTMTIAAAGVGLLTVMVFLGKGLSQTALAQDGIDRNRPEPPASGSSLPSSQSPPSAGGGHAAVVSVWNALSTPISFYGKVVDQSGAAVPNAEVRSEANNNVTGVPTVVTSKTDASGFFAITGMHGIQLAVTVSKEGYYKVNHTASKMGSAGGFRYYSMGGESVHVPDKEKPVVFTLFKPSREEELDRVESATVRLPAGGQAVNLDVKPHNATARRRILIRAWSSGKAGQGAQPYDWRVEIQPDHGKICARNGELEFEAPEAGYQTVASIEMPASLPSPQWQDVVERDFFVRFDDGVFARFQVHLAAPPNGSVFIKGFLNPKVGSRNLERDPH